MVRCLAPQCRTPHALVSAWFGLSYSRNVLEELFVPVCISMMVCLPEACASAVEGCCCTCQWRASNAAGRVHAPWWTECLDAASTERGREGGDHAGKNLPSLVGKTWLVSFAGARNERCWASLAEPYEQAVSLRPEGAAELANFPTQTPPSQPVPPAGSTHSPGAQASPRRVPAHLPAAPAAHHRHVCTCTDGRLLQAALNARAQCWELRRVEFPGLPKTRQ